MANLIIQENGVARTRPAVTGEEITIKTPCSCSDVTGVQINGVAFPFYDASGNSLADMTGLFAKDSLIRVLIDADKMRAYILNANTNSYIEGKFTHGSSIVVTLKASSWSNNSQTVTATGVTSDNRVDVSPTPQSFGAYIDAGIICTSQSANALSFECEAAPTADLTINVGILNV